MLGAATLRIVNRSFRVRERNCSVDVCWEWKKFCVVCSHLSPESLGHMYARDLEHLSMLVTTRLKDAHVHICVDAQTGLGTGVPGPPNSNIGTATTLAHRAEKQRLLECFVMEHSLTATNIFSNNDASNTNIYMCNHNGCHEPQQIDYILVIRPQSSFQNIRHIGYFIGSLGLTVTTRERHGKAREKDTSGNRLDGNATVTAHSATQCARS